jgi:hypothetical protein
MRMESNLTNDSKTNSKTEGCSNSPMMMELGGINGYLTNPRH